MINKKTTAQLLWFGIAAGPIYLGISLFEILTRDGFDITRHSWSLLSNGELGWMHVTAFLVTGISLILASFGLKISLKKQKAGLWGPILFAIYGASLIAAGIFKADPMDGFPPPNTPFGPATIFTTSGILHLLSGMIGFTALIAACFVFAKRFAVQKNKLWKKLSIATGIMFLLAFIGIAMGSGVGGRVTKIVVLGFVFAVVISFSWITFLFNKLRLEYER